MKLDLSSLRKSVESLERAINLTNDDSFFASISDDARFTIRSGVIQNFEVAYEFSWKFVQRWLRENVGDKEIESPRSRKELFRQAARFGLIEDPQVWFSYGDARNLTTHTYNENTAENVYETALKFAVDAKKLLLNLEKSND